MKRSFSPCFEALESLIPLDGGFGYGLPIDTGPPIGQSQVIPELTPFPVMTISMESGSISTPYVSTTAPVFTPSQSPGDPVENPDGASTASHSPSNANDINSGFVGNTISVLYSLWDSLTSSENSEYTP